MDGVYLLEVDPSIFSACSKLINQFLNSFGEVEYAFFFISFVSKATCFSNDDAPKASAKGAIFILLGSSWEEKPISMLGNSFFKNSTWATLRFSSVVGYSPTQCWSLKGRFLLVKKETTFYIID